MTPPYPMLVKYVYIQPPSKSFWYLHIFSITPSLYVYLINFFMLFKGEVWSIPHPTKVPLPLPCLLLLHIVMLCYLLVIMFTLQLQFSNLP